MRRSSSTGAAAAHAATTPSVGHKSGAHRRGHIEGTCVQDHREEHDEASTPSVEPRVFLTGDVATAARGADEAASAGRRLPFVHPNPRSPRRI